MRHLLWMYKMLPSDRWSSLENLKLGRILPLSFVWPLSLCFGLWFCTAVCVLYLTTLFLHGVQVDGLQLCPQIWDGQCEPTPVHSPTDHLNGKRLLFFPNDSIFLAWLWGTCLPGTCPSGQQSDLMFRHLLWPELSPLSTNSYIEVLNPLLPQNVAAFWEKVFKDVVSKMRSYGWTLIQSDWWASKKALECRHAQRDRRRQSSADKQKKASKETNFADIWSWTPNLQNLW